ncbi:MAG: VRR-NUC domain-containing protein [Armatimonadetes bacterium]|nr:VRR-NUC domain-containing protein [Armatimonadota bacterium]
MSTPVNYPRGSGKSLSPAQETPATAGADDTFDLEVCPDAREQAKRRRREQAEQIAYFDQVRACRRPETALIAALANENAAGKAVGVMRWKMGVRAGLPDIGVFVPRGGYSGLFIEMKCSDGVASDVRATQAAWHDALEASGYRVVVAYGWRRAWAVTCDYLGWDDTHDH